MEVLLRNENDGGDLTAATLAGRAQFKRACIRKSDGTAQTCLASILRINDDAKGNLAGRLSRAATAVRTSPAIGGGAAPTPMHHGLVVPKGPSHVVIPNGSRGRDGHLAPQS